MASATMNLYSTSANNTDFRAWGKFISDGMVAGGFTIVATDIDWSTVSAPGSNDTYAGYEIFESDDAGVGQHKWYVKFRYGRGVSANRYMFGVQVGWGYSGSNITGNNLLSYTGDFIPGNDGNTSTSMPCYICADADGVNLAMFDGLISGASHCLVVCIERIRDKTGAKQDTLNVWSANSSGQLTISGIIPYSGNVYNFDVSNTGGQLTCGWRAFYGQTQYTNGLDNGLATYAPIAGAFLMECLGFFGAHASIVASGGSLFTFDSYGDTHRYVSLQNKTLTFAGAGHRILMRYDL